MKLVLLSLVVALGGCGGSRCPEVRSARDVLAARKGETNRTPDMRLTLPFDRANALIADLLKQEPVTVKLDPPDLGPIEIPPLLTATVRTVVMRPAAAGKARFAVVIDIGGGEFSVVAMDTEIEVTPALVRKPDGAELAIGFGPQSLVSARPGLGADAKEKLKHAVGRLVPAKVKDKVPRFVLDAAAHKLGGHLTGAVWETLRQTLLKKLGDVTAVRVRLPDVPVASTSLRSTDRALIIDMTTDLPVRRGLVPGGENDTEVGLRLSGSTVAELGNWAIEKGHAPRWYDRHMKPKSDGEFRPHFDFLADDRAHPFKVYSFQDRGGCSYFRVGVSAKVAVDGDNLKGTLTDQQLEKKVANPLVEALAWTKYFLIGGFDRTRKMAAHTRIAVGNRTLATRVTSATLVDGELHFALAVDGR